MNVKRTFGTILTLFGIIGLIYAGASIILHGSNTTAIVVIAVIAILFFFTGIKLISNTRDES